jgi:Arc/MetJ-type ribon-helix-helix transcriptional regulator
MMNKQKVDDEIMKLKSCHFDEAELARLEELVEMNYFPSMSEGLRAGLRFLLHDTRYAEKLQGGAQ